MSNTIKRPGYSILVTRQRYPKMPKQRYTQLKAEADSVRDVLMKAFPVIGISDFINKAVVLLAGIPDQPFFCLSQGLEQAKLVSADDLYLLSLETVRRRKQRWLVNIDVRFHHNPKGSGRKAEQWPAGMGGRGKVATLQVPQVILADVKSVAKILAWNPYPEGRLQALRAWLSER